MDKSVCKMNKCKWYTVVFFCLVIVVHESLVCPEQLKFLLFFRKILQVPQIICFFVCIWTLSNNDCMVLRSIFSHRGQLRDSFASITEDSNTHWCSRRKNHALRAFWTFEQNEGICIFFLFCLNIIFFFFSTALQFSRRQIKSFWLLTKLLTSTVYMYIHLAMCTGKPLG